MDLRKSVVSSSAGKTSHSSKPPRPLGPMDRSTEKARKLKESRDYSFLFEESPLSPPVIKRREHPTSSNLGETRHASNRIVARNVSQPKCPLNGFKSTLRPGDFDRSSPFTRSFQTQSKYSQPFKSLPSQIPRNRHTSGTIVVPSGCNTGSSTKAIISNVAGTGPGRPSSKASDPRKAELTRKLPAESPPSSGNKILSPDRNLQSFTRNFQRVDSYPPKQSDRRPVQQSKRLPRYSEKSWPVENRKKRARGGRSSEDEKDDDSFIDDEDPRNVSSLIQRIMGYNPNRYRGKDDLDDRSMEVGFRTIQAEERRSAREARLEDEKEFALIKAEERAERLLNAKKKSRQS